MNEGTDRAQRRWRRPILPTAALTVSGFALWAGAAAAAPTDVDRSFGTNGRTTINAGGGELLHELALGPDGKAVGVGRTSLGDNALVFRVGGDGGPT